MDYSLIYALNRGELVHIDSVVAGLSCGCTCPACGDVLIARNAGKVRIHHFAHHNAECAYAVETSLHLLAKQIIAQECKIFMPVVSLGGECLVPAGLVIVDEVILEKRLQSSLRVPDIQLRIGDTLVLVEIYVTHKTDSAKKVELANLKLDAFEVDLSKFSRVITHEDLYKVLMQQTTLSYWLFNSVLEKAKKDKAKAKEDKARADYSIAKQCKEANVLRMQQLELAKQEETKRRLALRYKEREDAQLKWQSDFKQAELAGKLGAVLKEQGARLLAVTVSNKVICPDDKCETAVSCCLKECKFGLCALENCIVCKL